MASQDLTKPRTGDPGPSVGSFGKIALIVRREYVERVRTKAFIFSTLLIPVFLGSMLFIPMLLARLSPAKPLHIAVVDETGSLYEAIDAALATNPDDDFIKPARVKRGGAPGEKVRRYQLEEIKVQPDGKEAALADLSKKVTDETLDAYIVIPADIVSGKSEPTYYGRTVSEFEGLRRIGRAITDVLVARRLSSEGIDPSRAQELTRRVDLQTIKIGAEGQQSKKGFVEEWLVTMSYVMLLYMNLILYGSALARSLIEEKMNRVVEVLLSSVKPFELMAGKIIGIGAAGLTQFVIWALAAFGFSMYQSSSGGDANLAGLIDPKSLVFFVLYFILGYFLYAALFCIVGAACTTEHEAQSAQQPVVMLIVIPLLIALLIVRQPASTLAVTMSHVPFFSPIVMFMRINILPPPMWEILLNLAAIFLTIAGVVWVAGRIFRVGVLMTGKRATIPELMRWLKAA
jgi:ABC-2 type transport system permease protein